MPARNLIIRGKQIVLPASIAPASIHISDGMIASIGSYDDDPGDCTLIDVNEDSIVMPGLVDSHVHINEPGRTEWEGFATATRAAAAGGVTTVIDMPLNSLPPTVSGSALDAKRAAAAGQCYVDVGFWGGAVPDHLDDLPALHDAGVFGF